MDGCRSSTNVSLKAREVLILGQMPSYEERMIQMETILKNAVNNNFYGEQGSAPRTPSADVLKELSDSRYTVYDVLPSFFNHTDPMVTLGELKLSADITVADRLLFQLPLRFTSVAHTGRIRCFLLTMKRVMYWMMFQVS